MKPKKLRSIFALVLVVAVAVGVVVALVRLRPRVCEQVEVRLAYTGPDTLVTVDEIHHLLAARGVQLIGTAPGSISRTEVEDALRANIWFDTLLNIAPKGSSIVLDIRVKSPLMVVYPENSLPYFIGKNGELLPDNIRVQSPLYVLNGHVKTAYSPNKTIQTVRESALTQAFQIVNELRSDSLFASQITQLYVTPTGEFELYNGVTHHTILLGKAENIPHKLQQLRLVYDHAMLYLGFEAYQQVDVRFKNRVFAIPKKSNIL